MNALINPAYNLDEAIGDGIDQAEVFIKRARWAVEDKYNVHLKFNELADTDDE